MARAALRHPANAPGPWFVDERCIDCGTCREVAPELFGVAGVQSVVTVQPDGEPGRTETEAWLAAQACPTTSIGTTDHRPRPGRLYPREVDAASTPGDPTRVFDVGYCSEDSFGASAWFVVREDGNLLIDAPRFTEALARPIAEMGGIAHILLSHRDDVADADRYAARFGSRVWIHTEDRSAAPFATDLIEGDETTETTVARGVVAVPVPGHTRGSVIYVVDETWAFTGDSLAWNLDRGDLTAFRGACWYSWSHQRRSLAAFAERHTFSWVLPGHGGRMHRPPAEMADRLDTLVGRMARQ